MNSTQKILFADLPYVTIYGENQKFRTLLSYKREDEKDNIYSRRQQFIKLELPSFYASTTPSFGLQVACSCPAGIPSNLVGSLQKEGAPNLNPK